MEGFSPNESTAGFEKLKAKYHYTFTDGRVLGNPKIFECDADDAVLAQDQFFTFIQESGIDITESDINVSEIIN